ncbi:MAG: histidine phosphatase family protein [Pseudomonadota bacterium]
MAWPLIYYVRHGQTDWNAEQRYQGQRDIPLNDTGREQARHNGRTLANLLQDPADYVYISSPLSRSRETMELVRSEIGLPPDDYKLAEALKEISYGDFEGVTQAEIKAANREMYYERKNNMWTFRPSNGESHADVVARVRDWLGTLDTSSKYLITAHGAVGRVMRHILADLPPVEVEKFAFPQDKVFLFDKGSEELF